MKKNEKSVKPGSYADGVNYMVATKVFTKSMVVAHLIKGGKKASAAASTAGVIMSARQSDGKRGKVGCSLGNGANTFWGIRFYLTPRKHVTGEEQSYRIHKCSKDEIEARTKLAAKRELPKCRAGVAAKADKARAARLAKREAKVAKKAAKVVKVTKVVKAVKKLAKKVKTVKVAQVKSPVAPVAVTPAPVVEAPVAAAPVAAVVAPVDTPAQG